MGIVLNQDLRPCTLGSGTVTPWAVKPKILESKRNFVTIKKSLPNKYASHRVTITVHFITKYKKTESPVKTTMQDSDVLAIILLQLLLNDLFLNTLSSLPQWRGGSTFMFSKKVCFFI